MEDDLVMSPVSSSANPTFLPRSESEQVSFLLSSPQFTENPDCIVFSSPLRTASQPFHLPENVMSCYYTVPI